jgi:glucosamine--fructose-6-phosphate aminotransferase (isomerizing)
MCGVFGFVSLDGEGPNIKRLKMIARVTMRRGPHAFGFAWVDGKGRLRMFKKTGRIVDHLALLAMAHDARFLIGHCRYATHGSPENNLNNHPHPADGGWIVHNGVVRNYESILADRDMAPVTDCDSEVLGLLIEQETGTFRNRCAAAAQLADGPLALMGLWSRPGRLVAIRSGNPLSIGIANGGTRAYLASLPDDLPGKVLSVKDKSGVEFTKKGMFQFELASDGSTGEPSLFK